MNRSSRFDEAAANNPDTELQPLVAHSRRLRPARLLVGPALPSDAAGLLVAMRPFVDGGSGHG